ncbi:hypothetical protein FRC11_004919 [Ceratobasidium sp. 423]|nr:hypothetical protein FRC11_004919 [Ceratobasidium sp. 423]
MVFMRSKKLCQDAAKFLRGRLPLELQDRVVWVHADMSREFIEEAMIALRNGELFGITCTDVAGMGIDISDIDLVVQYQLPSKYCSVSQHFGRAARDPSRTAKAILLIEPKYFDDVKQKAQERSQKIQATKLARKRVVEVDFLEMSNPKRQRIGLDTSQGTTQDMNNDEAVVKIEEPDNESQLQLLDPSSVQTSSSRRRQPKPRGEIELVMDQYINIHLRPNDHPLDTRHCRREPGNQYFATPPVPQEGEPGFCCLRCCPPPPSPSECCDVCNPTLADSLFALMEEPPKSIRTRAPTTLPNEDLLEWTNADEGLEEALDIWREQKAKSLWGENHIIGGGGILSNKQIERIIRLAQRQLIPTLPDFQRELRWYFMPDYGAEVLAVIHSSHPPLIPEPHLMSPIAVNLPEPVPLREAQPKPRVVRCSACQGAGHNMASWKCPVKLERLSKSMPASSSATLPITVQPLPAVTGSLLAIPAAHDKKPVVHQNGCSTHPPIVKRKIDMDTPQSTKRPKTTQPANNKDMVSSPSNGFFTLVCETLAQGAAPKPHQTAGSRYA